MFGLHVTPACNLASNRATGLVPAIGKRSKLVEGNRRVWMFPSWAAMEEAEWLAECFDEEERLADCSSTSET